jgi:hypothetical protein
VPIELQRTLWKCLPFHDFEDRLREQQFWEASEMYPLAMVESIPTEVIVTHFQASVSQIPNKTRDKLLAAHAEGIFNLGFLALEAYMPPTEE